MQTVKLLRSPQCHLVSIALGLAVLSSAASLAQAAIVSRWEFDGNANDSVGGRNGTLLGDASYSNNVRPGASGNSLAVDGTLDKMFFDVTGADALTGTFSLAMWVNADVRRPDGTLGFFGTRSPDGEGFDIKFRGNPDNQIIRVDVGDGSAFLAIADRPFSFNLNEWHHIAAVVTPSGYSLFADGNLLGSASFGPGVPILFDALHDIAIGSIEATAIANGPPFGEDFSGLIDDVRIYNTALSQSEIRQIMAVPEPSSFAAICAIGMAYLASLAIRRKPAGAIGRSAR